LLNLRKKRLRQRLVEMHAPLNVYIICKRIGYIMHIMYGYEPYVRSHCSCT
jgi:hypothetical protein